MPKNVAYARGFRAPTHDDIDRAMGDECSWSTAFRASFGSLPKPTSKLDWLATNKETGQTYDEFIEQCPYLDDTDAYRTCIYLTLLDHPEFRSSLDMDLLIDYTRRFFQTEVRFISLLTNVRWDPAKQSWLCKFLSCLVLPHCRIRFVFYRRREIQAWIDEGGEIAYAP